jgi:hypothetical protein
VTQVSPQYARPEACRQPGTLSCHPGFANCCETAAATPRAVQELGGSVQSRAYPALGACEKIVSAGHSAQAGISPSQDARRIAHINGILRRELGPRIRGDSGVIDFLLGPSEVLFTWLAPSALFGAGVRLRAAPPSVVGGDGGGGGGGLLAGLLPIQWSNPGREVERILNARECYCCSRPNCVWLPVGSRLARWTHPAFPKHRLADQSFKSLVKA